MHSNKHTVFHKASHGQVHRSSKTVRNAQQQISVLLGYFANGGTASNRHTPGNGQAQKNYTTKSHHVEAYLSAVFLSLTTMSKECGMYPIFDCTLICPQVPNTSLQH